jgi:hypothetical protein
MQKRQERFDVATHAICGPGSDRCACLAGMATLLLGAICLADAFVAPGLFGPLAASVLAAERLLCAVRSSSTRTAVVWIGIALGWMAVASCMLHTPLVSIRLLQWLVVLIVASSAVCRLWTSSPASAAVRAPSAIGVVAVLAQLATLFGGTGAPLARVAAAVAIELVLIGVVRLLEAGASRRGGHVSVAPAAPANLGARAINLDTGVA